MPTSGSAPGLAGQSTATTGQPMAVAGQPTAVTSQPLLVNHRPLAGFELGLSVAQKPSFRRQKLPFGGCSPPKVVWEVHHPVRGSLFPTSGALHCRPVLPMKFAAMDSGHVQAGHYSHARGAEVPG